MRPQDRRIAVGLLCRWALLATVSALALGAVLLAGASVEHEASVSLTPSDMVWSSEEPRTVYAVAWTTGVGSYDNIDLALGHLPGGDLHVMATVNNALVFGTPTPPVGVHRVRVRGIGYGPLAFLQTTCRLVSLPTAGQPLWMIDAAALGEPLKDRPAPVAGLLEEARRHGIVICYDEGPLADFAALSDRIRRLDSDVLIVRDRPGGTFRRLVSYMGRSRPHYPCIVTAAEPFARRTAAEGFITYLVNPAAKPTDDLRLQVFPTLEALTDHLRDERETIDQFRTPPQPPSDATSRP